MPSNDGSTLPEYIGAFILGLLTYALSYLFPDMTNDGLRLAIAGAVAIVGWVVWHYVIGQRFKRFAHWLGRIWTTLLNRAKAMLESAKARIKRFRACVGGELEQCRSELKTKRERLQGERAKVDKHTLALASLSQPVLSLFDEEMGEPDELEWSGALAASERAAKCARAALHHRVTKIVYYDPTYRTSWIKEPERVRDFFVGRWFVEKNARQLRDWINEVLKNGSAFKSLIVFAQDVVPDTVAEVPNDTCLLRRYLNAGGRVVWMGDIPFWYQGKAGRAWDKWHQTGPWEVLAVYYHNYLFKWKSPKQGGGNVWDSDLPVEITLMGQDIRLGYPAKRTRIRPVPCQDVSVTYALIQQKEFTVVDATPHGSRGDFALCWKKSFCGRYPHSGFMQYVPGEFLWNEINADFFRFAVSGWPLLFD